MNTYRTIGFWVLTGMAVLSLFLENSADAYIAGMVILISTKQ